MSFDATWRIALETTAAPGSLNASLVTELSGLDAEAKRLRKIGQNPIDDLRPKVDALRASVSRVRAETIAKGRDRLDQYRTEWSARRDKNATAVLMRQNYARLRVAAMDDTGIEALTMSYLNGADLDLPTLRELQARARTTGDLEHLVDTLRSEMTDRHANSPWISESEDALQLVAEIDRLESTPPGSVAIDADGVRIVAKIADLVDYDGELSQPA